MRLLLLKKNGQSYALFKEGNAEARRIVESGEGKIEEISPLRWVDKEVTKYRSTIYIARSTCLGYSYSYRDFLRTNEVYPEYYKAKYDAENDWWRTQAWE